MQDYLKRLKLKVEGRFLKWCIALQVDGREAVQDRDAVRDRLQAVQAEAAT